MKSIQSPKTTTFKGNRIGLAIAVLAMASALSACKPEDSSDSTIALAKAAMTQKDLKAAEIHLKNLLQKSPDSPEGRYLLGKLYFDAGDFRAAEKELRRSVEKGYDRNIAVPKLLEALFQLGEQKIILEDSANLAVDQIDAKAEVLNIVGRANFALGKKDEAKAKFEAAIAIKPDYIPGYVSLIQMRAANGDRAGAKDRKSVV